MTRDMLLKQYEKSGIPSAIKHQKEMDAIINEFNHSYLNMALEIATLRTQLNVQEKSE